VSYNLAEVQLFPRLLVVVAGQDSLYAGNAAYANMLKKAGKNVKLVEVPAGGHMFRVDPHSAAENVRVDEAISEFVDL
jgi:acetyl esterase/lipase